jgi:hypothetical protein
LTANTLRCERHLSGMVPTLTPTPRGLVDQS